MASSLTINKDPNPPVPAVFFGQVECEFTSTSVAEYLLTDNLGPVVPDMSLDKEPSTATIHSDEPLLLLDIETQKQVVSLGASQMGTVSC